MRGFTFSGPGRAELTELPDPTPGPGEILLKVESNTVCGTDLRIMRGEKSKGVRAGVVLGHEASGTIAELGDGVEGYEIGTLCGISPIFACGVCRYCQTGVENLCESARVVGYDVDGGLGEWMVIPAVGVRAGRLVPAPDRRTARAAVAGRATGLLPQRHGPVPRRGRRRRRRPRCRADRVVPPAARRDRRRPDGDRLRPVPRAPRGGCRARARPRPSTRRARTSPRSWPTPPAESARTSPWSASVARSLSTTP